MIKNLGIFFAFLGCLFILFLVSVMSTGCPSCSESNFYKTFGIGLIVLLLMFYAINWLVSKQNAEGVGRKILLFLGLLFLFAIFVLPQIYMFIFVLFDSKTNFTDLSLGNWLMPAIVIFLGYLKFGKKKDSPKELLAPEEIEKRKKDYKNMLDNHLITQENYEKMIKQLDGIS